MLKLDNVGDHTLITLTCDAYDPVPVIYADDNRGKWRSDFATVLAHFVRAEAPGKRLTEALAPATEDYVVLKPKHSAFYATPLDTLLAYLKTKVIILVRLTTSACILLTAGELYVRDFEIFIPSDCVAIIRCCHQD
jgi:nicotinamidase-related amidase